MKEKDGSLVIEADDEVEKIISVSPEPADYIYKMVKVNDERYSAVRVPNVVRGGQSTPADPMYYPISEDKAEEIQGYEYPNDQMKELRRLTLV